MKIHELVDQVADLLHRKGRLSYRALKLDFSLDDEQLDVLKEELIDKLKSYNTIRHSEDMDEDEKEAIRHELFEGDHARPFL